MLHVITALAIFTAALTLTVLAATELHQHNARVALPTPPAAIQQYPDLLLQFQRELSGRQDTPLLALAEIPRRQHRQLLTAFTNLAAERRWHVRNREHDYYHDIQTFWVYIPKEDIDLLRRLEADIGETLRHPPDLPIVRRPDPNHMLFAKLTVQMTGPGQQFLWTAIAAPASGVTLVWLCFAVCIHISDRRQHRRHSTQSIQGTTL